jgi:hypothetical protein
MDTRDYFPGDDDFLNKYNKQTVIKENATICSHFFSVDRLVFSVRKVERYFLHCSPYNRQQTHENTCM